jgi:hypothetical protein
LVALASTNSVDHDVPAFLRSVIQPDAPVENLVESPVEGPVEISTEKSAELAVGNLAHEAVSQAPLPVQPETPSLPDRSEQIAAAKRSLADRMQRPLASIEDAASMIDGSRPDLTKLKAMLGREDTQYLLACEALATVALDHLVPTVDLEREKFDLANDPVAARAVLERAEIAARKLAMLDLGAEARERVARFLGALRDLQDQEAAMATAAAGQKGLRLPPQVVGAGLAAASVAANAARQMRNKLGTLAKARTSLAFSRMNKRLKNLNAAIAAASGGAGGGAGGAGPAAVNASLVALRAVLDEFNTTKGGAIPANNANKAAANRKITNALNALTPGLVLNQANQNRVRNIKAALATAGAPLPAPANLNTNLTRILGNATRNFAAAANQAQFKANAKAAINTAAAAAGVPLTNQRVVNAKATINALNP